MNRQHYMQKWRAFAHELSKQGLLTTGKIWDFQKSILSMAEQERANRFELELDRNDPRSDVMDESDRAYLKAKENQRLRTLGLI